ncbi:hypothetical protein [Dyella sp.]|uniref:hypothetical protein n=1 Tax=Dyella sp. TaxID=1869338 RepID=UPI002D779E8F|nr:hypothetical protein [Dyella sp.]HET7333462.1 hypothetical protein [Dyella sp.]
MRTLNLAEVDSVSGGSVGSGSACVGGAIGIGATDGWAAVGVGVATVGACYETYNDLSPAQKSAVKNYVASSPTLVVAGTLIGLGMSAGASLGASAENAVSGIEVEVVTTWQSLKDSM